MKETFTSANELVDHLFRHEAGKMVAVLSRIFGIHHLQMAEDVVQESFLKAAQTWKFNAPPDNPSAWLMQVAKNAALDILRRKQRFDHVSAEFASMLGQDVSSTIDQFFLDSEIADSQLRLIFACCHPALKEEDQIALTLKTISGFGVNEIAKALLTHESTIQKRLYRAKQFIRNNNIQLEIPSGKELMARLDTVYTVLYLLFNEGYNSTKTDELIRKDLCAEAMRLCLLLCEHQQVSQPAAFALLSLMCFHASRFDSRLDENSSIILLQYQDRSKWDKVLIKKGYYFLNKSSEGNHLSVYHVESAIAAEHCLAASFEETNFTRLLELYDMLYEMKPTAIVRLNRAIVLSYCNKTGKALEDIFEIDNILAILEEQYLFNAVIAELYIRNGQSDKAKKYLERAMQLTQSEAERKLLKEKMTALI